MERWRDFVELLKKFRLLHWMGNRCKMMLVMSLVVLFLGVKGLSLPEY
jgi:hypothetical protein